MKLLTAVVPLALVAGSVPFLLGSSQVGSASFSTSQSFFCDSFGREWSLSFRQCPELSEGLCVSGLRDINNELSCGAPIPVTGTLVNGILTVTSLDNPSSSCVTVAWRSSLTPAGVFSGTFLNEVGQTGSFVLQRCNPVPGPSTPTGIDPSMGPAATGD